MKMTNEIVNDVLKLKTQKWRLKIVAILRRHLINSFRLFGGA